MDPFAGSSEPFAAFGHSVGKAESMEALNKDLGRYKECPECGGRIYEADDGCEECAIRAQKSAELMAHMASAAGGKHRPKKKGDAHQRAFKGIVGRRR